MPRYVKGEYPQELNAHFLASFWIVDEGFWKTKQAGYFRANISESHLFIVPGGEKAKTWFWLESILETLCQKKWPMNRAIVALGGGALLDLAALAAHLYKRGTPFISIPTTTLAMIDASLGGKCGINFAGMKNMVGAHQDPLEHYQITSLLGEDLKAPWVVEGMSEAYKHGLIASPALCKQVAQYLKNPFDILLKKIIEQAAAIKLEVVEREKNQRGIRHLLNLGHTSAHGFEAAALEAGISLSHGSAVAIGLALEAYLMEGKELALEIAGDLKPLLPDLKDLDSIWSRALICMKHDKKGDGSTIAVTRFGPKGQMMLQSCKSDSEPTRESSETECWIQRADCDKLRDCWKYLCHEFS